MLGYVLDFFDFYWRGWHFWAFNVADAAITIGVALMILDLLGVGRLACIQNCLSSARSPSTRTASCWPRRTCWASGWRCRARSSWGLDANRVLDLGIYIIIAALVGAKLLLLFVDFDQFRRSPADLLSLARSGGVFYGGLILAVAVAFWYIARHRMPFWTTCDVFAPGIALGHVTGRLGCFAAGCCYGKPTDVPWAVIFTEPAGRRQRRHAARHPAAPDAALRGGRRAADPGPAARHRSGAAGRFAGRTFWSTCSCTPSRASSSRSIAAIRAAACSAFSTSQFISLVLAPLSLVMLIWLSRRRRPRRRRRCAAARRAAA